MHAGDERDVRRLARRNDLEGPFHDRRRRRRDPLEESLRRTRADAAAVAQIVVTHR